MRDALALEERGAVKQLEQDAIDRDKADQMRVAEEHLAEALRVEQKALRARNRRRHALRQAAYGADALFGERGDLGLALQQTQLPRSSCQEKQSERQLPQASGGRLRCR